MKKIILSTGILLIMGISLNTLAQEPKKKIETAFVEVSGVCNECKVRIEQAALIRGVKFVEWNKETKVLKVIYKPSLTDMLSVQQAVAESGHDTEAVTASDASYQKLPACCAYRDGVETH